MASLIIIALLLSSSCNWDIIVVVRAAYDGTVLESKCSDGLDYGDAKRLEIEKVTNTLISGAKPGPPSAYVCAMSDRHHLIDGEPGVWAWATCAESLAQPDCTQCVQDARDLLLTSECVYKAGAHMFLQDCSIQYEKYAICHPY